MAQPPGGIVPGRELPRRADAADRSPAVVAMRQSCVAVAHVRQALGVGVALTAALVVASGARPAQQDRPSLLRGAPLGAATGLRLLVADNPPFVLDVDRNRMAPVAGVRATGEGVVSVVGVGGRGGVVIDERAPGCSFRRACLFGVRADGARAAPLGLGRNVAPASDGTSVWVQRNISSSACTVQRFGLDGVAGSNRRSFPCSHALDPAGSLGLIVRRNGDQLVDPATGRAALRASGIVAAGRGKAVLGCPGFQCAVLDLRTRRRMRLPWSDALGGYHDPVLDHHGRFVAISFGVPSWGDGGRQVLDVWVLDFETGKSEATAWDAHLRLAQAHQHRMDTRRTLGDPRRGRRTELRRRLATWRSTSESQERHAAAANRGKGGLVRGASGDLGSSEYASSDLLLQSSDHRCGHPEPSESAAQPAFPRRPPVGPLAFRGHVL